MESIGQARKHVAVWTIKNWRIINFKKNRIKNRTWYYFDDIIVFEDFDFDFE